jgi:hypothetical protein
VAEKTGIAGWSKVIATWVGMIAAVIGGWTAIDQQQKAIAAEQAQADKDYALQERQFQQEVRASLIETFKMFEIFNRSDQLAARERIYAEGTDEAPAGAMKLNDVFIYFDFFDALQICVLSKTCDEYVASELFKPYAVDAWNKLGADAISYRTEANKPKFGEGVEWLAGLEVVVAEQEETAEPAPAAVEEAPPSAAGGQ